MDKHTLNLANFAQDLRFDDLPLQAVEATKVALLDHLACGLQAAHLPWTDVAASLFPTDLSGRSVAYARPGRTSSEHAALVNGTAGHGFELDDILQTPLLHPGSVIVPASLAYGLEVGSSGREIITSILLGYEVISRAGAACENWAINHGFHITGLYGPMGSSTAVAKLMVADAHAFNNTWGFAATMGSGIKAFQKGGGMTKRLHAGLAAARGITAARVVLNGAVGPDDALCGPSGFLQVFGQGDESPQLLDYELGSATLAICEAYTKPYPTCGVTHPIILAIRRLGQQAPVTTRPRRIRIGTSARGLRENSNTTPTDIMAVQYSIEFTAALAYVGLLENMTDLTMEAAERADVRELVALTEVYVDNAAEAAYPARLAATVTIEFDDGTERSDVVHDMGAEQQSTGRDALVSKKFKDLTKSVIDAESQESIIKIVSGLDDTENLEELAGYLGSEQHVSR